MEPKIYLVVFDVSKNQSMLVALHQYIMDSKDFIGYWNHIPFVYAVKTYLDAHVLSAKLRSILTTSFLVAEIDPYNLGGLLPRSAWDWFSHSHAQLSLPNALQQSGLGGLGGLGNPPKK